MRLYNDYDRGAAVEYAHRWAYDRNPAYYNYENIGGDCTNFISQCVFSGCGTMNYTPTFGWYYINANKKAPAWTGVPYLYNYLIRSQKSAGPAAEVCELKDLKPGDIIQLSFTEGVFGHSLIVVSVESPVTPQSVLIATHTYDADYKPFSLYNFQSARFLHIIGTYRP